MRLNWSGKDSCGFKELTTRRFPFSVMGATKWDTSKHTSSATLHNSLLSEKFGRKK
jgi:hypothetical protein